MIEREAGCALQALYLPVVHEPLPDRFAALLELLAVREPAPGADESWVGPQ